MGKLNLDIRYYWCCIAVLALVYFTGLFVPLTGDAGKYAAISRNIVESGDWINLQIHHQPYDQKPHLIFWLGAIFFKLFGMSALVFRMPVLLFSVLGFYSTYKLGYLLYNRETGLLALLVLLSSEIWILFSNDIHTDILMASATVFGIWQLFVFLRNKNTVHFILGHVGIGLAVLSKGLAGLMIPVFLIGGYLLIKRNYRDLFHPRWLLGGVIVILFFIPTIIGIYQQMGVEGLHFYFWENNVGRVLGSYKGNNNDIFFYIHTSLYILLPWSLLVFLAFYLEAKGMVAWKFKNQDGNHFFLGIGIFLSWILLSSSKAKAPHYLLVVTPFIAILTAWWLVRIFSSEDFRQIKKAVKVLQLILATGLFIFSGLVSFFLFPSSVLFWVIYIVLLLTFILVLFKTKSFQRFLFISVIAISALNFSINLVLFPGMFSYHSTIPACETFNRLAESDDILHSCNSIHRELFFYCKNPGLYLEGPEQLMQVVTQPNTWIYMDEEAFQQLKINKTRFDKFFVFKHKNLTRQSFRFLNPKTREKSLKNMYLVKIRN